MRLTLVIDYLSAGGAERVMSIMANYWAAKEWDITLVTFDDGTEPPFYYIDCRVCQIHLNVVRESSNAILGIWNNLKRVQVLQSAIADSKPDAVISFLSRTNVLTLLATRMLNAPVIVSERVDPAMSSIGKSWDVLRSMLYPFAAHIVVQTEGALRYFSSRGLSSVCIIPNPVLLQSEQALTSKGLALRRLSNPAATRSLVAIGRLTEQKGFDLLLEAFACLKDLHSEWTLTILGEGELRAQLESLRESLGLSGRVEFPGVVRNPYTLLAQADLFVMSSRFEGFPNALCEAMSCGVAVISTDCPSGPSEIIRDGVDGILVPNQDVEALAAAMDQLMSNEQERQRLSTRALEVTERFSLNKVMEMWKNLLIEVV